MPFTTRPITRRTTLAAAPLAVLAACEWGPEDDGAAPAPEGTAPPPEPDEEQVAEAVTAIAAAHALVEATAARHQRLSGPLADLVALHLEHLTLLDAEPGEASARVPAKAPKALARVRSVERDLQATLTELAGTVSSGALARTLAAMAAGVAQRVELLPRDVAPQQGGRG